MNRIKFCRQFLNLGFILFLSSCASVNTQPIDQNALETIVATTLTAVANNAPAPAETSAPDVPQFSAPRALQVAYIKDGNVYIWTEGENSVGLTSTHDAERVRISDDGQVIAFLRNNPNDFPPRHELWAVNTSGLTNTRLLISYAELEALKASSPFLEASSLGIDFLVWQPGTHKIAYSTVPFFEGPGYAPGEDLRLVHADTLEKTTIFDFGQGGIFYFSPDGAQAALSTPDHISLANADGSNLRPNVLTYPLVGTYSEYQYHPRPIWAADSQSLRVTIPPAETLAVPVPPTGLWNIPTDGTPATQLGSIIAMPFAWPDNAFSPDLNRVAYVKNIGAQTDNQRELHLANPDGSGDVVFATGDSLQFEQWTPDGTRFVYLINNGAERGIYLGHVSGSVVTISTAPETVNQMRWVDNSRFLFLYKSANIWELRISDMDGTRHAFIDSIPDDFATYDFTQ